MVREKKVSCVIVNYNDAKTTERLVRRIYTYQSLDAVVMVDNCSTDDSREHLERLAGELGGERVILLFAKENKGYGGGNNLGITYSYEVLQMDYVLIANPDVEFSDVLVSHLVWLFEGHRQLGVVSAVMEDAHFGQQKNGWPLHGLWGSLARSGPVCRRLFCRWLEYRPSYFDGKKAVYVDVVHGSLLMVDVLKMLECGGYDEKVFLYQEEEILGYKMLDRGWRTALLLTDRYVHRHAQSISKSYQDVWQRQKIRNQSAMYYYKNYLRINRLEERLVQSFFLAVRLEIWFCSKVLKWKW